MSGLNEEKRKEQLDIVLRLNKLTKRGRLSWDRQPSSSVEGQRQDAYETTWKGYRLIVEDALRGSKSRLMDTLRIGDASYCLRIRPQGRRGDDKIVIPPMPAIDDLVSSIRRVNDEPDRSKGEIGELRSFKRRLDEDL